MDKDKGPLFFSQDRIGKNGKLFKMYKFRTMVVGADDVLKELLSKDEEARKEYAKNKKLKDDPRVTKIGKFLRSTSLDEFPQFFNVLKGDMSLVGPRPYLPREEDDMGYYYYYITQCKPGITGLCYNICPKDAISMIEDEYGFKYPKIDKEKCVECGLCSKVCPIINNKKIENKPKVYVCYNKDEETRAKSSSGGIFTLIATEILNRNGVVFGAAFNGDFSLSHAYVEKNRRLR